MTKLSRRKAIQTFGLGSVLGTIGFINPLDLNAATQKKKENIEPSNLKITRVRSIVTAPFGINLVIVKVETNEDGLYGLGCATFTQRAHTVAAEIDKYLDEFCKGKNPANIEDLWQTAYQSSYWRNGPVLNNALSGLDQALWDIKGKMAGLPLYELLGGKVRFAVDTYTHASGPTAESVMEEVAKYIEEGYRNIRIQLGGYGSTQQLI
jgi:mannonate dehydratase